VNHAAPPRPPVSPLLGCPGPRPYTRDEMRACAGIDRSTASRPGLQFSRPVIRDSGGLSRASFQAAGADVVVEADTPLVPAIEAPLTAFAPHCFARGRSIVAREPVDARFGNNLDGIAALWARWFDWPEPRPALDAPALVEHHPGQRAAGRALFFSGGIDSFFSLLRLRGEIDALVNLHGFDVAFADQDGEARMRRSVAAVAAEAGLPLVRVRSNLRTHRLFDALAWDTTNVAALAMVAHLLRGRFGRIVCAAEDGVPPLALHPAQVRLHGSAQLDFEMDGYAMRRMDKAEAIAGWQPVQRHLQVCGRTPPGGGNCGSCVKCLRVMAIYASLGCLGRMTTFPGRDLEQAIAALEPGKPTYLHQWEEVARRTPLPGLRAAIEDLVDRTRRPQGWKGRIRRVVPAGFRRLVRRGLVQHGLRRAWPAD